MNKTKQQNYSKGKYGEQLAKKYLESKGYKVLAQNWRYSRYGEIDIISLHKNELIFIEVKTRSSVDYGNPIEAVDERKINKILKLAECYINLNPELTFNACRFDIIGVILKPTVQINHYENTYQF